MRRRFMRWLAVGVALLLLGSACTFGAEDSGGRAAARRLPTSRSPCVSGRTRTSRSTRASRTSAAEFEAANPNVTLEFETFDYDSYIQTLQTALPAGTEADILQMFGTWTCSYADNLAPVPADVSSLADAQAAFFEAPIGGYTCDDTLYGFPQEFNIEYGATLVNTADRRGGGRRPERRLGFVGRVHGRREGADRDRRDDVITPRGLPLHRGRRRSSYSFFSLILQARRAVPRRRRHVVHDRHPRSARGDRPDAVDRRRGHHRPRAVQRHGELGRRLLLRGSLCDGPGRPVGGARVRGRLPRGRRRHAVRRRCRRSARPPTSSPTRAGGSRSRRTARPRTSPGTSSRS